MDDGVFPRSSCRATPTTSAGRYGVERSSGPRGESGEHSGVDRRQAAYLASSRDLRGRAPVVLPRTLGGDDLRRTRNHHVDRSAGRFRVLRRQPCAVDGRPPDALPRFPFVDRLGDLRRLRHSGAGSGGRDHLGLATAMVARGIRARRDPDRVGDVPHDGVLRRSRPSTRRTTRSTAGRRQLPLGSRRGVDRRVLGLRAASHLTRDVDARQGARVGRRACDSSDRGGLADVSRDAPPARHARRRSHGDRRADAGPAPRAYHKSGRPQAGGTRSMTTVAVVAHAGKAFDGGLLQLRRELERQGVSDPRWYEVPKSRKAPSRFRRAIKEGAELVFVWGGYGTLQRCIDALDGADVPIAIVPAGTANLPASNPYIPKDIEQAVSIGLHGAHRKLDVGRINGERFAVMAGAGIDALMIREADAGLKDRIGRVAYVWTGVNQLGRKPFEASIKVDGSTWFKGKASCVLLGNFGELFAGVEAFEDARPDDGMLELGVVTADSVLDWVRTIGRTGVGASSASPFVQVTKARSANVQFDRKVLYELDGGDRKEVKKLAIEIEPAAVDVCVPAGSS